MGNNCIKSAELKCPSDYDKESFDKILRLFDRLDSTGDMIVDKTEMNNHELGLIAEQHNIEEISNLAIKKENQKKLYEQNIENIKKKVEEKLMTDIETELKEHQFRIDTINNKITELEKKTNEEKRDMLKKTISDNKKSIGFWDFFKYMRDRINKFTFN